MSKLQKKSKAIKTTLVGSCSGNPQYFCCWPYTAQSPESNYCHYRMVYMTDISWKKLVPLGKERTLILILAFGRYSLVSCYINRKQQQTNE